MLFDPKPGSWLERANKWMTPERGIAMQGIGMGLQQLASGQPVNMSPAYGALMKRQQNAQMRETLQSSGILDRFTPEQQALLAQMEPSAAQKIIMQSMFAPAQARDTKVVGNVLVDAQTGQPIYEAPQENPTVRIVSGEDATQYGLPNDGRAFELTFNPDGSLKNASAIGGGGTVINNNMGGDGIDYGSPPTDMAWVRDESGNVMVDERGAPIAAVIRGSKTDRDQVASITEIAGAALDDADAKAASDEAAAQTNQVVSEDIGRALRLARNSTILSPVSGFLGDMLQDVGGTNAANFKQLTMSIRANIGFDRLQAMREASPTGGALGNVTIGELERLESILGSLSQKQDTSQLIENLERLDAVYSDIMRKAAAYPNAADFGFGGAAAELSDEDLFKQYGLD